MASLLLFLLAFGGPIAFVGVLFIIQRRKL